ncbi:helix-turn-helix domain-containing protein [Acinetobacter towneri]|uniref:helix-turn-helix domain-containing protein n=1 Tax=Acinetobacter towneri TaxID=202956 RepID=UPI0032136F9E
MRTTHQQQVLEHLKSGNTLKQADAIHLFNCYRLSSVIQLLRKAGHNIVTHKVKNIAKNGTYARYEFQGE